jgi:hypothetical protein
LSAKYANVIVTQIHASLTDMVNKKASNLVTFSGPMPYYKDRVYEFNLPAGHTCPQANECLMKADKETGKMVNGPNQRFRCYAAAAERFPGVRDARWRNLEAVKKAKDIVALINPAIPKKADRIRIHGSGDFFKQSYFDAWVEIARLNPDKLFWAFTKSVQLWVKRKDDLPQNFIMQASRGGKKDHLIDEYSLKSATVFRTLEEAINSGMPIDIDDTYACSNQGSFALVDNFGPDHGGRALLSNE